MIINRRRYMAKSSGKSPDSLVWVSLQTLKSISGYAGIPVYQVGAKNLTWSGGYSIRIGFSYIPNVFPPANDSQQYSRIWFSGHTDNAVAFLADNKAYNSGWKTYAEAGFELNQTIYTYDGMMVTGVNIYHNNEADKLSVYDRAGVGPVYFNVYQANSRPSEFFALIDKQYIM